MDGVMANAPDLDTVGWFARDADLFARVGEVLMQTRIGAVRPRRLVVAEDALAVADRAVREALDPIVDTVAGLIGNSTPGRLAPVPLEDLSAPYAVLQGSAAWRVYGEWIDTVDPRLGFEVAARFAYGRGVTEEQRNAAKAVRDRVVEHTTRVLADDTVICLPTMPFPAPPRGLRLSERGDIHQRIDALVDVAGWAGVPQISLPLADVDGLPVGLSLIGAGGADEMLMAFAREIAGSV
jgi:amidase